MFYRKDVVMMAVAGLLASSGYAMAEGTSPKLSLDPMVVTADDAGSTSLLMTGLNKAGAGKTLSDLGLKIYGWVEGGYTFNNRHNSNSSSSLGGVQVFPGPFNHEKGNHFMLNQVDLRVERAVDTTKFDVGGLVELLYGSDAARIHSTGLGYNGADPTDDGIPVDPDTIGNFHPTWQFDIPQAFVTVNLPVGSGLQLMVGKFVTLFGYETIDPRPNQFYSHSYLFSFVPGTQTGVLGSYQINEQWGAKLGVTRGWDIALEDNNAAVDVLGQVSWVPNKQLSVVFNFGEGPENGAYPAGGQKHDSGHYRTVLDPLITYQVTDAFKLGAEVLYWFDGGANGNGTTDTHHYGDVWGAALYAGYTINDYVTINARAEKVHEYLGSFAGVTAPPRANGLLPAISMYEVTLGASITPMPHDQILKNFVVRPEVRYDFTDSSAYNFYPPANVRTGNLQKDELTFGADFIFQF